MNIDPSTIDTILSYVPQYLTLAAITEFGKTLFLGALVPSLTEKDSDGKRYIPYQYFLQFALPAGADIGYGIVRVVRSAFARSAATKYSRAPKD